MPVTSKPVKGGVAVTVTCDKCGGPIVGADEWGMYCEKRCREAENKKAAQKLRGLLDAFTAGHGLT